VYDVSKMQELQRYQILREIRIHAAINHPNIIKLQAAFRVSLEQLSRVSLAKRHILELTIRVPNAVPSTGE
jgi:serine/threonine protein kinase